MRIQFPQQVPESCISIAEGMVSCDVGVGAAAWGCPPGARSHPSTKVAAQTCKCSDG